MLYNFVKIHGAKKLKNSFVNSMLYVYVYIYVYIYKIPVCYVLSSRLLNLIDQDI